MTGFGFQQQTPAKIDIEPRAITFEEAGARQIVVSNRGAAALSIGVSFETKNIGYFLDASGCTGAALPPGQQCKIAVTATRLAQKTGPARIDISYAGRVEVVTLSWASRLR